MGIMDPYKMGPEPIIINGVKRGPYKWPAINGQLGFLHPFFSGDMAPNMAPYFLIGRVPSCRL